MTEIETTQGLKGGGRKERAGGEAKKRKGNGK